MDGKDATTSITNLAIAGLLSNYLLTNGIAVDPGTIIAVGTAALAWFGRWRAGGIKSIAGVSIPRAGG
jgi:hypothetical protein